MVPDEVKGVEGSRERPVGAYERELAATIGAGTERWLTELRLALFGIIAGVGIGAADIGLSAGGWVGGLVAGIGSVVILVAILWRLRPRGPAREGAALP